MYVIRNIALIFILLVSSVLNFTLPCNGQTYKYRVESTKYTGYGLKTRTFFFDYKMKGDSLFQSSVYDSEDGGELLKEYKFVGKYYRSYEQAILINDFDSICIYSVLGIVNRNLKDLETFIYSGTTECLRDTMLQGEKYYIFRTFHEARIDTPQITTSEIVAPNDWLPIYIWVEAKKPSASLKIERIHYSRKR